MDQSVPQWLTDAAHDIAMGRVGVLPTDTILGLSSIVTPHHVARLNGIKGRALDHPLVVLVSGWAMARTVALLPNEGVLAWPGPVTYVCQTTPDYHAMLGPTVGLRYPMGWWIRGVIDRVRAPVFSTSVNETGQPPVTHVADLTPHLREQVDFCVTAMVTYRTHSSMIIDLTTDRPMIRRHG